MYAISMCPKCRGLVSLSVDMDESEQVRCPLCQAEYPLHEAIPPRLIPTGALSDSTEWTQAMLDDVAQDASPVGSAREAVGGGRRISVRLPNVGLKKAKAWWRAPLEIVSGALIGCTIAYYGLALCLGADLEHRGFPVLRFLPGVRWLTSSANPCESGGMKCAGDAKNAEVGRSVDDGK